jgi:DNA primase
MGLPDRRLTFSRQEEGPVEGRSGTAADSAIVRGARISRPDWLIYPECGISKIQLARYCEGIAVGASRTSEGRPLTLVHCSAGVAAPCKQLKHAKQWGPSALRRVKIQEKTKLGEALVADSIKAVVSLAQMGIVEIHTCNSTTDDLEPPQPHHVGSRPGSRSTVEAHRHRGVTENRLHGNATTSGSREMQEAAALDPGEHAGAGVEGGRTHADCR